MARRKSPTREITTLKETLDLANKIGAAIDKTTPKDMRTTVKLGVAVVANHLAPKSPLGSILSADAMAALIRETLGTNKK